ncbi:SDR family NAD(P)-dependent oxidoreductase [Mucilaginibacter psychrotolerans]|uniref:SDR family NAD(P)-dependent oxidoreductase n=1 Tax=Mucilaginibacter psychrotolerans TaxID=1524096 RepID=A0A4Y8S6Q5_9SPHI|nr:SDR family NAD(P)-dependent oxidoreductase [Mucilaginibacter psychrotolerans]TFF34638.1 SDR family NAD(P)-dependent oxidoreductase [Mucilaginibacter psychrotolerans]
MQNKKTWFITGASKGFGLSLVTQLLNAGHNVAATSRNVAELIKAVNVTAPHFLPMQVELGNEDSVGCALHQTNAAFHSIDVVINNAGYGIGGSIEELTDRETRDSFEVNVFGTLNVIRMAMPYMRQQHSGHIINIASIAGFTGATGWSVYAATKFSVVGLSEVLAQDVAEFGVKVTVVAPGAFRTSFLTDDSLNIAKRPIADYTAVHQTQSRYLQMNGAQSGDPEKAAAAIIEVAQMENPPLYLLLGEDAYDRAMAKLQKLEREFRVNEAITKSMAFNG